MLTPSQWAQSSGGGGGSAGATSSARRDYEMEKGLRVFSLARSARELNTSARATGSQSVREAVRGSVRERIAEARRIKSGGNISTPYLWS